MPSKRVSMKGRGADLFFGDYTPPAAGAADSASAVGVEDATTGSPPPALEASPEASDDKVRTASAEPVVVADLPSLADAGIPDRGKPDERPTDPLSTPRKQASNRASTIAGKQADAHAVMLASELARNPADSTAIGVEAIELIRRAVREPGREVAYVRLTPEEKGRVSDIVYEYKKRGQRTTDNELYRIAVNHLLHDYHEHGAESVLARVLASLLA